MIQYQYKDLFEQNSVKKKIIIQYDDVTLTNADLYSGGIELEESICSEPEITFGSCEPSMLKFTIVNKGASLLGKVLTVKIVLGNHTDKPFTVGRFKVAHEQLSGDRSKRDIEAYDALYDVINSNVIEWYNGLFPSKDSKKTLKQFRDSFFTQFGITQKAVALPNDNMEVFKTVDGEELSGRDVITCICEINGCFGHIGRDGVFNYIRVVDTTDSQTTFEEIDKYISAEYEDTRSKKVTKVQIRQEENDIGVTVGTGSNPYIVEGNFLLYGLTTAQLTPIAQNFFDAVKNVTYLPAKVERQGNPCIEVGDAVLVRTKNKVIKTIVLERTIKGSQALRDNFVAQGTEKHNGKVNSVQHELMMQRGRANILKRTIEETQSTITDIARGLQTQITQNANSITLEATRATEEEGNLRGLIDITARDIRLEVSQLQQEIDGDVAVYNTTAPPNINNYPAYDFTYNIYPDNATYPSDELFFEYTQEYYERNARSLVFDTVNMQSYRFLQKPDVEELKYRWYWQPIADGEFGVLMQKIASLEITVDGITADVKRIEKNAVSMQTLESKIEQTAESITSTVSKQIETLDGKIQGQISQIKQTSSEISTRVAETEDGITTLESRITQTASQISAKVDNKKDGKSFSWNLTDSDWSLYANGSRVFRVNADGAWISGYTKTETLQANYATIKKLDAEIVTVKDLIATNISAVNGSIDNIKANIANINTLVASKATIAELNATNAKVENIESDYITTNQLNAVDAKFKNLNASNITAGTLKIEGDVKISGTISGNDVSITNLNASNISSGKIATKWLDVDVITTSNFSAQNIQAKQLSVGAITGALNAPNQGIMYMGTIKCSQYQYYVSPQEDYKQLSLQRVTIGGHEYRLLGLS